MIYVVAISQKEADSLALYGHTKLTDAEKHLADVKMPPTDPFYAHQYSIYRVNQR